MKIGIQTWGSEGDVRPFFALGHGLARRGHEVTVVFTDIADRRYDELGARLGVRVRGVATPVLPSQADLDAVGEECRRAWSPPAEARIILDRLFFPVEDAMYAAALELCRESELVIGHYVMHPLRAAAEVAGVPEISVTLTHNMLPSAWNRPSGAPRLGRWGNRFSWWLARKVTNSILLGRVNERRRREGLPLHTSVLDQTWRSPLLNIVPVSPALCARMPDWEPRVRVTGFLNVPETAAGAVPEDAEAFLRAGEPPVLLTFGSLMATTRPELDELIAIAADAGRRAGCRMIVQVPPSLRGEFASTDAVLIAGHLPHPAVMPRCAAVVHHCGAGTTQATLLAGVPSIGVPHAVDQHFWASELRRVGAAPAPVGRWSISARALARRIRAVLGDPGYRRRSAALGERMAGEDGVGAAALAIEEAIAPS